MSSSAFLAARRALSKIKWGSLATIRRAAWRVSARPISRRDIEAALRRAGLRPGDLIVVHSALSRLGRVEGGPRAMCAALEHIVGPEGTIVMPTFHQPRPILELLQEEACVDLRVAPSVTGKLSEEFRLRPDVLRSSHPFSSCSAWGRLSAEIVAGHESTPFLCGAGSPLANVWKHQGRILGLGVDLGPVSFYHVIEDTWDDFPVRTRLGSPFPCSYVDPDGRSVRRELFVLDPVVARTRIERNEWLRRWLTDHLSQQGILHNFMVGDAQCWVMDAAPLYNELVALAKRGITIYSTQNEVAALSTAKGTALEAR